MICLSVVSHGQLAMATELLRTIEAIRPSLLSRIIYTRNLPEPDLPPLDLGHIILDVITNPTVRGFGANHNAAFAQCRDPFFCVANPDILLTRDPFPDLIDALASKPDLGLVAPRVLSPAGLVENSARALYTPSEMIRQKLEPRNQATGPDWLAGMFMLFRSSSYRAIDGFDTRYFLYLEDVDICTRLRLAGWTLVQVATASVIHAAQRRSHRSLAHTRWHLQGMLRYWRSPGYRRLRALLR